MMKKQYIILIVLIVISILVGGVYFGLNYVFRKQYICWPYCQGMTDQDRDNIKKSALDAQTVGWQTYKNDEYGFEIRYPKNMPINYNGKDRILNIGKVAWEPSAGSMALSIEDKNILQYRDFIKENWKEIPCTTEKNITLGKTNFQSVICPEAFAGGEIEMYFVEHNQRTYNAEFIKSEDEKSNELFRQILFTFNFTK